MYRAKFCNYKTIEITLSDVFNELSYDDVLDAIPINVLEVYLAKNREVHKNEKEYIKIQNHCRFDYDVDIDTDDVDLSEYEDYEIEDEYNSRKLYKGHIARDFDGDIRSYIGDKYNFFPSALTDDEVLELVKKELKK